MEFISKNPNGRSFWVEKYTQNEKEFLEGLGFKEIPINKNIPESFRKGINPTMNFTGSEFFGLWTENEELIIVSTICEYLAIGEIDIYEYVEQ